MGHYDEQEEKSARYYNTPDPRIIKVTNDIIFTQAWDQGVEVPPEMFEFVGVMTKSAASGKYEPNNWLRGSGAINSDHKSMHASMFRHLAESSTGGRRDVDTNLDPLLHLACRALMFYTRIQRGLV
jgi:hypothetical protein